MFLRIVMSNGFRSFFRLRYLKVMAFEGGKVSCAALRGDWCPKGVLVALSWSFWKILNVTFAMVAVEVRVHKFGDKKRYDPQMK